MKKAASFALGCKVNQYEIDCYAKKFIENGWEVGYHIAKAHTGHGYATEALMAFLPFIVDKLKITSIDGIVLEENIASHRVLEKCGFELIFKGTANYQGQPREVRRYVWPQKGTL